MLIILHLFIISNHLDQMVAYYIYFVVAFIFTIDQKNMIKQSGGISWFAYGYGI
ncbi:hypothetical protein [Virgibacillus sp. SK37]|uniref:hypothetical protein n=1 Tax=Virgibacillus sp. SK37 TaxID=403957 RepID=UPI0014439EFD|nr:hypothetical protein [Virgibacillus sp. SK37]